MARQDSISQRGRFFVSYYRSASAKPTLHRLGGIGAVQRRPRLGDLVDLEADVAVVAHEAVEVGLAEDEQPAIGQRTDVGLARLAGQERQFAEHFAAAEANPAVGKH